MMVAKAKKEGVERLIIKIPRSVAEYFRRVFPHGQRSDFVAGCILRHKREAETRAIEEELREIGGKRQIVHQN